MSKTCCICSATPDTIDAIFFEFPVSPSLRLKWKEVIQLTGRLGYDKYVCNVHFNKSEYNNVRGKFRLNAKVVPSLLLNVNPPEPNDKVPEDKEEKAAEPVIETADNSKDKQNVPEKAEENRPDVESAVKELIDLTSESNDSIPNQSVQNEVQTVPKVSSVPMDAQTKISSAVSKSTATSSLTDTKEDIEDIITNYHIQNKGQLVTEANDVPEPVKEPECPHKEKAPVYIEISVGKEANFAVGADAASSQDCLMVLESVQVEVDPANLMLSDDCLSDVYEEEDYGNIQLTPVKKPEPISLLTSTDDSELIIEEPKIDTVEVSDETDEDDMPLVRLASKSKGGQPAARPDLGRIMWDVYDYYCVQCKFTTAVKAAYEKHLKTHEKALQICQICTYTTASKGQFERHRRKHREERKFRCHICDYKARHNMSLVYHMKTHENKKAPRPKAKRNREKACGCGFRTSITEAMSTHLRLCRGLKAKQVKNFSCKYCSYSTPWKWTLKRHTIKKHLGPGYDPVRDHGLIWD